MDRDERERKNLPSKLKVGDCIIYKLTTIGVVIRNGDYLLYKRGQIWDTLSINYNREFKMASTEEIDQWNRILHQSRVHYSMSQHKLIPWFLPGDSVLMRKCRVGSLEDMTWFFTIFSHYWNGMYVNSANDKYIHCVPFPGKIRPGTQLDDEDNVSFPCDFFK